MKRMIVGLFAALLFGSVAQAQIGPWDGYYIGAFGSTVAMEAEDLSYGTGPFEPSGFGYGGFTGMNKQVNSLVFGFEASLQAGNVSGRDGANMEPFTLNSSVGLRGRFGVDAGRALPYLSAGIVASNFEADHGGAGNASDITSFTASGISYGIGVDISTNRQNSRFLRLEFQLIDYGDTRFPFYSGSDNHDFTATSQQVSVGYGISF